MTVSTAARSADAHLLDQDIKSGQLQLNLGLARVASAAGAAVSAGAVHGARVAGGGGGGGNAHGSVCSQAAEATMTGFDAQCARAEELSAGSSGAGASGSAGGGFCSAGPGSGIGSAAFPILPSGEAGSLRRAL